MTQTIIKQLADEFQRLGQRMPGDNAQPVATFTAKPWEAYAVTAALQAASRHPGLSDTQREMVLGFAHQIADQLVAMANAILGPDSAIATMTAMGFDPQFDVVRDDSEPIERDSDPVPADAWENDPLESHVLGERSINYVNPTWIHLNTDPDGADLLKCALCSRFFVQDVPLRLFQDLGEQVVLGFDVCEQCAPKVVGRMHSA